MILRGLIGAAVFLALSGCRVGPNYTKPPAVVVPATFKEPPPPDFKEAEAAGWKQSQPGDAFSKGRWWELYGDTDLNELEEQVAISNQNVQQAEARYRQAKAEIGVSRAALFPTLTAGVGVTETGRGSSAGGVSTGGSAAAPAGSRTTYNLPLDVSWEPDVWGAVRRGITASKETAQGQQAVLENAKLLYQAQLAQDHFTIHGVDAQMDLLTRTQASYQDYLTLTRNRYNAGVASELDVTQAESQLYAVQSQWIDLGVQRAQLEHAMAELIGKAPANVDIPVRLLTTLPPAVPVGVPSELLQRRPDVAAAERDVAAANEQIGIAMAAFYPSFTLGISAGLQSSTLAKWFTWPSRFWSVGPQLSQTLFDAGRRRSIVASQQAAYDATVAAYREAALTAMQQVEDNLAALRVLEEEAAKVQQTVDASQRALTISSNQYTAGTVSYLTVITSQAALLAAERAQVELQTRRLTASVLLIEALGGGWDTSKLPSY